MYEKKILFICMGNICRSPAAEGVMRSLLEEENMADKVYIDSAGTLDYHEGECADQRMLKHASIRGFDLNPHRARQFDPYNDFEEYDYIITMDNSNYSDIKKLDPENKYASKIQKITSFSKKYNEKEVPDPYYGGSQGFEFVLDLLEDSCSQLLEKIKDELNNQK
jgi:protein-tyrosine phosphatase